MKYKFLKNHTHSSLGGKVLDRIEQDFGNFKIITENLDIDRHGFVLSKNIFSHIAINMALENFSTKKHHYRLITQNELMVDYGKIKSPDKFLIKTGIGILQGRYFEYDPVLKSIKTQLENKGFYQSSDCYTLFINLSDFSLKEKLNFQNGLELVLKDEARVHNEDILMSSGHLAFLILTRKADFPKSLEEISISSI